MFGSWNSFTCLDHCQPSEESGKAAAEATEQQPFGFVQSKLHLAQHQTYMRPVKFFYHESVSISLKPISRTYVYQFPGKAK